MTLCDYFFVTFMVTCLCAIIGSGVTVIDIGVIVDGRDEFSRSINKSVEKSMHAANKTDFVRMNPIIRQTDLTDSVMLHKTLCDLVDNKTLSLLGTCRSSAYTVIQSFTKQLSIPFFLPTVNRGIPLASDNYIINMYPSFIEPVIDFIKHLRWDRIFYLFDSDDALWRLQTLYQAFKTPPKPPREQLLVDAIRIPDVSNSREILRRLDRNYNFDSKRIVVDLSSLQAYNTFLSQIIDVGMNRDGYHYLLGTLDTLGLNQERWKSFKFGGVNITGFQLVSAKHLETCCRGKAEFKEYLKYDEEQLPMEVALTVDAIAVMTTALKHVNQSDKETRRKVFPQRHNQMYYQMECSPDAFVPSQAGPVLLEFIKKVELPNGVTGKVAFDGSGQRVGHSLDVYHLSLRSPLTNIGSWTHGSGLDISLVDPEDRKEDSSKNRTQRVTTIQEPPFVQLRRDDNGTPRTGNDRYEGYCIDLIDEIASRVNFTYKIELVEDGQYGRLLDNDTWDGMIGEILEGKADIATAALTITRDREEVVRFSKPFMNTGISIMIKKPEKDKPGVFSFMDPLSYVVWGCISLGFMAVSFVLYMVGRFSPYEWQEPSGGPSDTFSFVNTLWFSLGALMQQGPDIFPRSLSGRVLGSVWWFFTLIMISSYTANLAAFLTFEKLTTPINSADDLVEQTTIKYGLQAGGSTMAFFKDSNVSTYRKMWHVMSEAEPHVFADKVKQGWDRVVSGKSKYAFLLESSMNNYYNQRKPCKTMKVGRNLDQKGYGIATNRDSELSHDINIAVLEMREIGELIKLEQKWWYSKGECGSMDSSDKGKSALNLSNVSGIFHILIGGLVLSMVISLSQVIFHAKIKPRAMKGSYTVENTRQNDHRPVKRVTIEDQPMVTCTTSNGGDPHLITFEDPFDRGSDLAGRSSV